MKSSCVKLLLLLSYILIKNCVVSQVWPINGGYAKSDMVSKLVQSYDHAVRPNAPKPLKIGVSLYFEYAKWHQNKLSVYLYFRQSWNDQRFVRQSNVTRFNADHLLGQIWEPDTYFVNAMDPKIVETGFIDIKTNGDVLWSYALQFSIACPADSKRLFDDNGAVNCTIPFQSYTYDANDISYFWTDQPTFSNVPDKIISSETKEVTNKYSVGTWSGVVLNIKIQTKVTKAAAEFVEEILIDKI